MSTSDIPALRVQSASFTRESVVVQGQYQSGTSDWLTDGTRGSSTGFYG